MQDTINKQKNKPEHISANPQQKAATLQDHEQSTVENVKFHA